MAKRKAPCGETVKGTPDVTAPITDQLELNCHRPKGKHFRHQDVVHNVTFIMSPFRKKK